MSTNFQPAKTPSWTDRMNIATMIDFNLGCDPATLVAGSTYRTANGAFTYKAQGFVKQDTKEVFSSITYNASSLSNCTIANMGMFANSVSFDALFEATVRCPLPDGIVMRATASSLITLREDADTSIMKRYQDELVDKDTRSSYLAPAISKLLAAFGVDFMNQFIPEIPKIQTNLTSPMTVYAPFTIGPDMRFFHLNGTFSSHGGVQQSPGIRDVVGRDSLFVYENFAYIFWSGILSDLGKSARPNILTDANVFERSIRRDMVIKQGLKFTWLNGSGIESVLRNKTEFRIPFENIDDTSFNAQYLCRSISWKSTAELIVDVLVATVSFFQLFWSALNAVASYFAAKSSVHGMLPHFVSEENNIITHNEQAIIVCALRVRGNRVRSIPNLILLRNYPSPLRVQTENICFTGKRKLDLAIEIKRLPTRFDRERFS
ncbi:hypothetical protein RhiJN_01499 [Ceratobasidium sp. AG-Ba]|nr:hypothetical protein RhiJN_01499 [Ceratobasidium sp. AG-Ba]